MAYKASSFDEVYERIETDGYLFAVDLEDAFCSFHCSGVPICRGPKTVSLHFSLGTVLVRGPKALDFYDGFCANKATLLKADGKDVVDVKFIPKEVKFQQRYQMRHRNLRLEGSLWRVQMRGF